MAIIGIEISDVGILAAGGDPVHALEVDRRSIESPGFALQVKKHLVYGIEALEQSRLHPRQVNNRYWAQLSTTRLGGKAAPAGNYAEMAFAHLEQIRDVLRTDEQGWIFAVPDFLDEAKLGLLLGMARELHVPVRGLVSLPVAAAQGSPSPSPIIHVDLHLHRVEIARVAQAERIALERTHVISEDGWDNLLTHLVKGVADHFVRATRFDPLHDASSEQQLYNQISHLVRRGLPDGGVPVELNTDRNAYALSVLPQMLVDASSALRGKIVDAVAAGAADAPVSVQLSHRALLVPGLPDALGALPHVQVEELAPGAGAIGALRMHEELTHDPAPKGLAFTTSRARRPNEPAVEAAVDDTRHDDRATHVLCGRHAYPLGPEPLAIGAGPDGLRIGGGEPLCTLREENGTVLLMPAGGADVRIDGDPAAQATTVRPGQRIEIGEARHELRLIVVHSSHEA